MQEKHEFLKSRTGHGGSPMKEVIHEKVHRESHGQIHETEKHPRNMETSEGGESIKQPKGAPHMGEGH